MLGQTIILGFVEPKIYWAKYGLWWSPGLGGVWYATWVSQPLLVSPSQVVEPKIKGSLSPDTVEPRIGRGLVWGTISLGVRQRQISLSPRLRGAWYVGPRDWEGSGIRKTIIGSEPKEPQHCGEPDTVEPRIGRGLV